MTKDTILAILRKENHYVSGETISNLLGISRAAVNKAIKSLRKDGYEILSTTNKGYYLKHTPDLLTNSELCAYLSADRMSSIECIDSVDSTNHYLRKLAFSEIPDGYVVLANEQTSGRGRRGKEFFSPKDKGIYLSMLFRPDHLPASMISLTAWTAVAVSKAIENLCHIRPSIKWVNDLLVNQKKLCGILTEMSVESESGYIQHIIIGIGLNVNEEISDFPHDLQSIATSLKIETGTRFCRAQLAAELIRQLDVMCRAWPDAKESYLDYYRSHNIVTGKEIMILQNQMKRSATVTEITNDFALRVQYPDKTEELLSSGEIILPGFYDSPTANCDARSCAQNKNR